MSAYAIHCLLKSYELSYFSDLIGALSLDAFDGRLEPFDPLVQLVRPHKGQLLTAQRITNFLKDSPLTDQEKTHVQDPYSFRCMPQVHGATKDALAHVSSTIHSKLTRALICVLYWNHFPLNSISNNWFVHNQLSIEL